MVSYTGFTGIEVPVGNEPVLNIALSSGVQIEGGGCDRIFYQ